MKKLFSFSLLLFTIALNNGMAVKLPATFYTFTISGPTYLSACQSGTLQVLKDGVPPSQSYYYVWRMSINNGASFVINQGQNISSIGIAATSADPEYNTYTANVYTNYADREVIGMGSASTSVYQSSCSDY
ncbi:hypothetical protein [Spirosoma oryzicola]|uniref:hypothetical protein n=1 Tax=Spirosoma oryzicola TaxID=2898794 RepID=UPI001E35446D|nr:hypothetical protein [Spirosoma oryzicola]UHG92087.1 hypothetical protein LQ777_04080 [Spirosoma oryzicola]